MYPQTGRISPQNHLLLATGLQEKGFISSGSVSDPLGEEIIYMFSMASWLPQGFSIDQRVRGLLILDL